MLDLCGKLETGGPGVGKSTAQSQPERTNPGSSPSWLGAFGQGMQLSLGLLICKMAVKPASFCWYEY